MRAILILVALASCRANERIDIAATHISDLQMRLGALENDKRAEPPPAWWCTADRCTRERAEGARLETWAWCPIAGGECKPTPGMCGAGCLGGR